MGEHNCYHNDVQECIKNKAYKLWEKDGCKQGFDLDYWLIAEETVKSPDGEEGVKKFEELKRVEWQDTQSIEAKNQSFHRHLGRR